MSVLFGVAGNSNAFTTTVSKAQNMSARFRDLHDVPHQLQRLLRQMDAALWIAVFEHPWQTRDLSLIHI